MKVFATITPPGSFLSEDPGEVLVGRLVANTEFVRALCRHGSFEEVWFFVGDQRDEETLTRTFVEQHHVDPARLRIRHVLGLPAAMAQGEVSVLHQLSHLDAFPHLLWLRDRYARATLPVTRQVHSLSYPRMMWGYIAALLHPPREHDAIFCSSQAGRQVVEAAFAWARVACARSFGDAPELACELPVIPLGVDVDALGQGDRNGMRIQLGLPADALVVLGMGRFSEHDKMDLLPVLQAFRLVVGRPTQPVRPLYLLLAGARQDSATPELVAQWARQLGVQQRLVTWVDFPMVQQRDLLAAADIFLSPSDNVQETFGLSVVEAMAAGLPVIGSDFNGYRDTITNETGIRIPTCWAADPDCLTELGPLLCERPLHLLLGQSIDVDISAMANAIHDLAMDDSRREAMGRRGRARARACYDWRVVIREYEQVWRRLAAKPGGPPPPGDAPSPLAMGYRALFAHYPSTELDLERTVRRLPLADELCSREVLYPVYPDLKLVFGDGDVMAALDAAAMPLPVARLIVALGTRWPSCEAWRARVLVAWLLKHGLVG
jgi:glycosyltransferase involved in cell wall biosynthesis